MLLLTGPGAGEIDFGLRHGLAGILRHHGLDLDVLTTEELDLCDWDPGRRWAGAALRLDFGLHGALWRCLAGAGLPLVAVNARGDEPLLCDLVGIDNRRLGAQVVDSLHRRGHHRFLVVSFPGLPIFRERVDGFAEAAARLGCPVDRIDTAWNTLTAPGEEQRLRERTAMLAAAGGGAVWCVHQVLTAQAVRLAEQHPLGQRVDLALWSPGPALLQPGLLPAPTESLQRIGRIIGLRLLARLSGDISPPARHSVAPIGPDAG